MGSRGWQTLHSVQTDIQDRRGSDSEDPDAFRRVGSTRLCSSTRVVANIFSHMRETAFIALYFLAVSVSQQHLIPHFGGCSLNGTVLGR